jgi:hypothetical protein
VVPRCELEIVHPLIGGNTKPLGINCIFWENCYAYARPDLDRLVRYFKWLMNQFGQRSCDQFCL